MTTVPPRTYWLRGQDRILFNKPHTSIALGIRNAGKSSLLENLALCYMDNGHNILDLFGSRDGEGLAWLRAPELEDKDKDILIVHGENVKIESKYQMKTVAQVTLDDFDKYRLIISASPLYYGTDDQFYQSAILTNKIYERLSWEKLTFTVVREASNLYYSRLKVSESQIVAKANMIYLIREARHVGIALGLDTIRFYALDIDIRSLSDYMFIKKLGMYGLPKDLNFLYSYVDPKAFRHFKPDEYVMLTKNGAIGLGYFPKIEWHKREGEDILKAVGIDITRLEPIVRGKNKGTFDTLGDEEHGQIIQKYMEDKLSMMAIAKVMSISSQTVFSQISKHNRLVESSGSCDMCRRVSMGYADKKVIRERA